MSTIDNLIREDLRSFISYAGLSVSNSDRNGKICLDSNEWFQGEHNRYPDPNQSELRNALAGLYGVDASQLMACNGSDEAIDLIFRLFCKPGHDSIAIPSPSYAMYKTIADFNGLSINTFSVDLEKGYRFSTIKETLTSDTKLLVLCSPNNPTSHCVTSEQIFKLLSVFPGIIVIDEAYVEFSTEGSIINKIGFNERVIFLRTLSKAYGLAGLRMGIVIAEKTIIRWLLSVKLPYNINTAAIGAVMELPKKTDLIQTRVDYIKQWRQQLTEFIGQFPFVKKVYPSQTNFLLIQVEDAKKLYHFLNDNNIMVRIRPDIPQALRISVGSPDENIRLMECLRQYEKRPKANSLQEKL